MTGYRAITRARKIVFWISAVLFVVTWPLLISYVLGIVISPTAKHPVMETGVIRVESLPSGARVYLDGQNTGKMTPAAIERLKAGSYRIALRKPGYSEWRARVRVEIQAVRRVSSAVLVPRVEKVNLVNVGRYQSERMSVSTQYLLFSGTTVSALRFFDLKTGRFLSQVSGLSPYLQDPVERISQPPWGNIVMVQVVHNGADIVLVLHLGALSADLQHVVEASFFRNVQFAWSPSLSGAVYFVRDGALWKMDAWTSASDRRLVDSVRSVGIVNNSLYFVDSTGSFGQVTAFGRRRILFSLPKGVREGLTGGGRIEYVGDGWGAVLASSDTLYLFRSHGFVEYHDIRGVSVDKGRNRFVVWSGERLGNLPFLSEAHTFVDHIDWAPAPPTQRNISDVTPAAGMSNCLYISGGALWIEPVLPGVAGDAQRVLTLSPGERYLYSESTGMLLVTDRAIGQMRVIRFVTRPLIPSLE